MRRILLVAAALVAVCLAGATYALDSEPADALTPTPSFTPVPANAYTAINTTGSPAIQLTGQFGLWPGQFPPSVSVSVSPVAGCLPPTVSSNVVGPFGPGFGLVYVVDFHVHWPTACVPNGASVILVFCCGASLPSGHHTFSSVSTTPTPARSVLPTRTPTPVPPTYTPTPLPPTIVSMVVDCDIAVAGVQSACDVPLDASPPYTVVDVILINNEPTAKSLSAFNFRIDDLDLARLDPPDMVFPFEGPCVSPHYDCNPNFNEAGLSDVNWGCGLPRPTDDISPAPGDQTFISCFNPSSGGPLIPAMSSFLLARVVYNIPPGATPGTVPLDLKNASNVFDNAGVEILGCDATPVIGTCVDAAITLVEPEPPPVGNFTVAIDCDVVAPGIQNSCNVSIGSASTDVDVYLLNNTGTAATLGAFNFDIVNPALTGLDASPSPGCPGPYFNCNPDFNQADITGNTWACGPPNPSPDQDPGPGQSSFISCFNGSSDGPTISGGGNIRLARVSYGIADVAAGSVQLSLSYVAVYDNDYSPLHDCNPGFSAVGICLNATINLVEAPTATPTPTAVPGLPDLVVESMVFELSTGGACNFSGATFGTRATVRNIGVGAAGSFVLDVDGTQQTVAGLAAGASVQVFFSGVGGSFANTVATVDATFLVTEANESNNVLNQFVPIPTLPPTCTPTATVTPTMTPTPEAPGVEKVPEGNANNADLSVPKANLWLCEAPAACAGPGEGALRVVERASNVLDGLGAYEFTVEYDNFVIESINPCDLVFGPGGAGAGRGPVDELDTSAVNPDCSPDPGAGGGTCAYSLVLENLVHFGCATSGQAAGPTGDFDLASLLLVPHPDLRNDIFPGNNNGVLTVLKDNGCELVDIVGHPVTGSVNGGLTPYCRDLAVTVRILEGDLDLDCDVDLTDAQSIASRYGAFFGGLLYSKWYDLEPALHDLDIDIKDVQKVFGRQGSSCQVPVPAQPPLDPPFAFGD